MLGATTPLKLDGVVMTELTISSLPIGSLKPYGRNGRTHSAKQIAQIAARIKAFGFNNAVLIDKNNGIIAGHGRVEAASLFGHTPVPCVRLEHLSEAQKRAYILFAIRQVPRHG